MESSDENEMMTVKVVLNQRFILKVLRHVSASRAALYCRNIAPSPRASDTTTDRNLEHTEAFVLQANQN